MREVVLDTETTGLDPSQGDRIVEIGAVELNNQVPTGRTYHQYCNPERLMPAEAFAVHGLSDDFLRDKPFFASIGQAFLDFVGTDPMVIHNAAFDMKFLNAELKKANLATLPMSQALDTLGIARKKFPGAQNSLDALCRRFGVDNSAREKHGALLDSEILAEVYLELVGGRQPDFSLSVVSDDAAQQNAGNRVSSARKKPLPSLLTPEEAEAHAVFVEKLGENALWKP